MLKSEALVFKDMFRLEIIGESLDVNTLTETSSKIVTFTNYWFERFVTNITHMFSDFSKSEIHYFILKNKSQLDKILTDPLFSLENDLYPIPYGMIGSYEHTVNEILKVLGRIEIDSLLMDLKNSISEKESIYNYTRKNFDADRLVLSNLFSTMSIISLPGKKCLVSRESVKSTKLKLLKVTSDNFQIVFELDKALKDFEKTYDSNKISPELRKQTKDRLLSVAYRISIFAICMEYIQDIEYNFVECLKQLKRHSLRKV